MDVDRTSVVVSATQLGISVTGFVATVYFIRTLGAAVVGSFFLFEAVTNVLGTFTRLGVDTAVEKRLSESSEPKKSTLLSTGLLMVVVPTVVVALLVLLVDTRINRYVGEPVVHLLVLVVSLATIRWLLSAALRAEERVALSSILDLSGELVRIGVSVAFVLAGLELSALLYGVVAGVLVKLGLTWLALDTSFGRPSVAATRSLLDFSKYNVGTNVSGLAYNWLDTLVLGLFVGKELIAVYEAAWKVSAVAAIGAQALSTTVFPRVSRLHSEQRLDEIAELFTAATTFGLLLIIPATVGAAVLGSDFLGLVYRFETGGLILTILVGEKLVQAVRLIAQKVLLGVDRPSAVFRVMVVSLVANVILNITLVPTYGLFGAAFATVLTVTIALVLLLAVLRDSVMVRFDWRTLGWQVISAAVMGAIVFTVQAHRPPERVLELTSYVTLGAVIYGGCVLVNGEIRGRVRSLVQRSLPV